MAKNLNIALVHTFIIVAEGASVMVAANALHLTRGAISQQIKQLEDAFECRLFERDGHRLELTHAGERFLGRAKRLLALNDEVWVGMTVRPLQGPVRLGMPYGLVDTVFPPVFKVFTEAWPPVESAIVCSASPELTERIVRGELDAAVVEAPVDEATGECLCMERLVWVSPRGDNAHAKRPLPLSMVDEGYAFHAHMLKASGGHGIEWRTVSESGNTETTTITMHAGLAVTTWLTPTVSADLGVLGPEAGLPELPMFTISLLLPMQGASAVALALAQCVRDGFSPR